MHKIIAIAVGLSLGAGFARAADKVDFEKDVAPLLSQHCVKCHGEEKQKGKLRLDSKANVAKGGKSGNPVLGGGDVAKSELVRRITLPKGDDDAMPPEDGPLPEKAITVFKDWISQGAAWPEAFIVKAAAKSGAETSAAPATPAAPAAPRRPVPPLPELPKDFKPAPAETAAIATLAKIGVEPRPIAQNSPWKEVNLRLKGAEVTDKSIEPLHDLTSLIEVRLGTTKVTDAGLATLKTLEHLQVLGLELTPITDAGLEKIKGLTDLVYLNLYGTAVTDAGLQHLAGLKHLRNIYLWQTKVTPEGAKKLQELLPLCEINTGAELVIIPPPEKKEEPKKDEKKEEKK